MFAGIICPRNNAKISPKYCLLECEDWCAHPVVLAAADQLEDRGKEIHISSLVSPCLRQEYYKVTQKWWAYPDDLYYLIRGHLMHEVAKILSKYEEFKVEQPVRWSFDDPDRGVIEVQGRYDLYQPGKKRLIDFKTVSDFGIKYIANNSKSRDFDKEGYLEQANLYDFTGKLEAEALELWYFTMTQGKRTQLHKIECEKMLKERSVILWDAFNKDVLPPPCAEKDKKWLCSGAKGKKNYCVFCDPLKCEQVCKGWNPIGGEK